VKEFKIWKNALRAELMNRILRQRVNFLFWLPVFLIEERPLSIVVAGIIYPPPRFVLFFLKHFLPWRSLFVEASR
jgi:hypothetical protein